MSSEDEENKPVPLNLRHTLRRDIAWLEQNAKKPGVKQRKSGLQYRVLRKDETREKPKPKKDTPCAVDYFGIFTYGVEFASTYKQGDPELIVPEKAKAGLCEGLQLMREGERFQFFVPADLGYGEDGGGTVPGGCVLIYDLELLKVDVKLEAAPFDPAELTWKGWLLLRGFQAVLTLILTLVISSFLFRFAGFYKRAFDAQQAQSDLAAGGVPPMENSDL
eukprot:TRINITY_DN20144_c0_g1_i1.p1 TRINITY_DN20144_c0_g1~~TRINITY_DN20144_c0_g1_i1.p1  ORF type:complete len:220 (-),score=77.84 TRINITY_DN20144_c0_g1_i1:160-819(-)